MTEAERRELTRGRVAATLLALLIVVSIFPFLALWGVWATLAELDALLKIVYGPLITLVSTVAGFYFGAASTTQQGQSRG